MTGGLTSCCLVFFLTLTSVSSLQRLNSINDLRRLNLGQRVPMHSLVLLYWFANTVEIDGNGIYLTFDPDRDYGSHYYRNHDNLLPRLPGGQRYYAVGNLYQDNAERLPGYVVNHTTSHMGRNRARIIIRVTDSNRGWRRIDQVYITQHFPDFECEGSRYDPDNTYEISANLLQEIRAFSVGNNEWSLVNLRNQYSRNITDFELNNIRNTWNNLAGLELLLRIVPQNQEQLYFTQQCKQNHQNGNALYSCCKAVAFCVLIFIILIIVALPLLNNSQTKRNW